MLKLLSLNTKPWVFTLFIVIFLSFGAITYFIAFYKVEKTISGLLTVDTLNTSQFRINALDGYLFKENSKVIFLVNQKFYSAIIGHIEVDLEKHQLVLTMKELGFNLISGSDIPVKIIIGYHTLISSLLI